MTLGLLKRRVDDSACCIDLGRLAVSPECSFARAAIGNPLTVANERAKLRCTIELANLVWN
jgi:hypothetical protein